MIFRSGGRRFWGFAPVYESVEKLESVVGSRRCGGACWCVGASGWRRRRRRRPVSQIARDAAGAALSRGHVPGAAARRS